MANESFSRDFYERYLRTDFLLVEKMLGGGDWKGAERLISDEGQGDLTVFIPPGAWRGEHDEIARMVRNSRAVQNDLEAIVRRRNQALGALGIGVIPLTGATRASEMMSLPRLTGKLLDGKVN